MSSYTVELHAERMMEMEMVQSESLAIFAEKNPRYKDSFRKQFDARGVENARTRIEDKFLRFCALVDNPADAGGDESVIDTLFDMANYSHMLIAAFRAKMKRETLSALQSRNAPLCGGKE